MIFGGNELFRDGLELPSYYRRNERRRPDNSSDRSQIGGRKNQLHAVQQVLRSRLGGLFCWFCPGDRFLMLPPDDDDQQRANGEKNRHPKQEALGAERLCRNFGK